MQNAERRKFVGLAPLPVQVVERFNSAGCSAALFAVHQEGKDSWYISLGRNQAKPILERAAPSGSNGGPRRRRSQSR